MAERMNDNEYDDVGDEGRDADRDDIGCRLVPWHWTGVACSGFSLLAL